MLQLFDIITDNYIYNFLYQSSINQSILYYCVNSAIYTYGYINFNKDHPILKGFTQTHGSLNFKSITEYTDHYSSQRQMPFIVGGIFQCMLQYLSENLWLAGHESTS